MANQGEKTIPLMTDEGTARISTFQGVAVRKPLLAVSAACDKSQLVLFDNDCSCILGRETFEGREIRRLIKQASDKLVLERKNGVYILPTWIVPPNQLPPAQKKRIKFQKNCMEVDEPGGASMDTSGFHRQGR